MLQSHKQIINRISDQVVSRYKKTKNILGIFLIGSAARGTFDEYSDIDFLIILAKRGKYRRENFSTETNFDAEILFNTLWEIKRYLKEEKASIYRNTSHMLANGKIIYQISPIVRRLQRAAQKNMKGKTKCSNDEIVMHKYSLGDFLEDARRDAAHKDAIAFYLDSHFLIQNSIELLFKLNNNFYRKPKEMAGLLRSIDHHFVVLLQSFYKANSLQNKLKKLEQISDLVAKKSGGKLSSNWVLHSK